MSSQLSPKQCRSRGHWNLILKRSLSLHSKGASSKYSKGKYLSGEPKAATFLSIKLGLLLSSVQVFIRVLLVQGAAVTNEDPTCEKVCQMKQENTNHKCVVSLACSVSSGSLNEEGQPHPNTWAQLQSIQRAILIWTTKKCNIPYFLVLYKKSLRMGGSKLGNRDSKVLLEVVESIIIIQSQQSTNIHSLYFQSFEEERQLKRTVYFFCSKSTA